MPRIDQLSINGATHDQINRQRSYRHRERIRSFTVHSAVTRLERTRNAFTSSIPLFSPLSFFRIRRIMKILKLPAAKLTLSENSGQSLLRFLDRSRRTSGRLASPSPGRLRQSIHLRTKWCIINEFLSRDISLYRTVHVRTSQEDYRKYNDSWNYFSIYYKWKFSIDASL